MGEKPISTATNLALDEFRCLVDSDPEPLAVCHPAGTLRFANAAFGALTGLEPEALVGRALPSLFEPDEASRVASALTECASGGSTPALVLRIQGAELHATLRVYEDGAGARSVALRLVPAAGREHPVTALPGRAALVERAERSLRRTRHDGLYRFAILSLDLDRFRRVNEGLGRRQGDALLRAIAARVSGSLRPGDMVAHIGADEFALLVDRIGGVADALLVAERVGQAMRRPFALDDEEVFLSASIGVAVAGRDESGAEELLRRAATALSRARARGDASQVLFDGSLAEQALGRLRLESELHRAVEREEFRVHYQPIVGLASGEVEGFEALLRWQHPARGLLAPGEFIAACEQTGLMVPIATSVLGVASARVRSWQRQFGLPELSLSMNFTSSHFGRREVLATVASVLDATGLAGRNLIVEITESLMMENVATVVGVLSALKQRGVRVHVDDFGTGYSSLAYLHRLPFDALKVDRSFVSRLGLDQGSDMIVRALVDLAHDLGRQVVAEGVETEAQLAKVRALGCDSAQGYFFARPLAEEKVPPFLAARPRWAP